MSHELNPTVIELVALMPSLTDGLGYVMRENVHTGGVSFVLIAMPSLITSETQVAVGSNFQPTSDQIDYLQAVLTRALEGLRRGCSLADTPTQGSA